VCVCVCVCVSWDDRFNIYIISTYQWVNANEISVDPYWREKNTSLVFPLLVCIPVSHLDHELEKWNWISFVWFTKRMKMRAKFQFRSVYQVTVLAPTVFSISTCYFRNLFFHRQRHQFMRASLFAYAAGIFFFTNPQLTHVDSRLRSYFS
jgi:hypothetical protein